MRKWILISVAFFIILSLYASTIQQTFCSTMATVRVKYCGGGDVNLPDDYWDSHLSHLTPSGLNFYLNDSLIEKTLTDNGVTLLLSLSTNNRYVLTYDYREYPYWIYTFNLTYTCSFYVDSTGKLNTITYAYGANAIKYNSDTNTLYIGLPLLGTQPEVQMSWERVTILVVIGFIISVLVLWIVRKH